MTLPGEKSASCVSHSKDHLVSSEDFKKKKSGIRDEIETGEEEEGALWDVMLSSEEFDKETIMSVSSTSLVKKGNE